LKNLLVEFFPLEQPLFFFWLLSSWLNSFGIFEMKNVLQGFAVVFSNGAVEYWKYDPSILTKKQIKALGIAKFKAFKVTVK